MSDRQHKVANKKSTWLIASLLIVASVFGLWVVFVERNNVNTEDAIADRVQDITIITAPEIIEASSKVKVAELDEADYNPYENEEIKAQLQQVSDIYAESIKYPITSQPVYSPEDVREYREYEQSEVDLPFPENEGDEEPIRISAATNTFQYFQGDVVNIRVQISGAPENVYTKVEGTISGANGDLGINIPFQSADQSLTLFNAAFDTKLATPQQLSDEMVVKLTVTIAERTLATTVAFKYAVASARITGLQNPQAIGPNLVMPLQLDVYKSGYYFVSGVLEDAKSGQPLVQLQGEQRLTQGNGLINLNAHISALRRQKSEGPYVLRSLRSYRGAEVGEQFDEPASVAQARFNVPGVPFSEYQDEQYVDELAQERLEFLRDMGSVDEETN